MNLKTIEFDSKSYTKELYDGIKECSANKIIQDDQSEVYAVENDRVLIKVKLARLYPFIFLLRRLLIIAIIILIDRFSYGYKISFLLLLQAIYLIFV